MVAHWTMVERSTSALVLLGLLSCGRAPSGGAGSEDDEGEVGEGESGEGDASGSVGETTPATETSSEETESGPLPDVAEEDCLDVDLEATSNGDLKVFEGVQCFTGFLTIDASHVDDLSPLASLRDAGSLQIAQSEAQVLLDDLSGLESLEQAQALVVNARLSSLDGLDSLWRAGSIIMYGWAGGGVQSLEGLEALQVVAGAFGRGNADGEPTPGPQDIDSLAPLANLQSCARLDVVGMDALGSLAGLETLESLDRLGIRNNPELADMTALDNLQALSYSAIIMGNPKLPTCQVLAFAAKFPELDPQAFDIGDNLPDECGG